MKWKPFWPNRYNEQLLLSTEAPGAWEGNEWHQAMAEDAKSRGDHAEAAEHIFMSMIRVFSSFTYFTYTPAYLRVPADHHAELARVALKAGDMKAVRREMEAVLESLPGDTRFVISFAPELRAAGCGPEADWLFDRVFDYLSGVAKEYPKCCEVRNFAAWMGAVCHRRLDESLAMAEQIVKEQPSAAHYIDTLAEVCFSRRDADRAISLMKRCIELDPSRDRHRKQLKRFEARDFDSPPLPTND